jgi:hypothetical protein
MRHRVNRPYHRIRVGFTQPDMVGLLVTLPPGTFDDLLSNLRLCGCHPLIVLGSTLFEGARYEPVGHPLIGSTGKLHTPRWAGVADEGEVDQLLVGGDRDLIGA